MMSTAALGSGTQDPTLAPHLLEGRRLARRGLLVLGLGLLPALAWMSFAPLSSAVIAPSFVKVDLDRRPVQHAEGGIVREVKVRDGQRVAQGEPLLVLGDVAVDADVNRLSYRVLIEKAALVRFEAEQAGAAALTFSKELLRAAKADPRLAEQLAKERQLFNTRRDTLLSQTALLRAQSEKILQESVSLRAQISQALESLKHQKAALERNRQLLKDGFVSETHIAQLDASVSDYGVKLEERRSELARAEQRMVDTELRIKSLESEYRQQASDQLRAATARLSEIQQELRKSSDASARQVITAPVAGEVMNLRYTSAGTVVSPREPIADIVPADPRLVIEAHVRPEDINHVQQGQAAQVRLTAFNPRTTPMVDGRVFYVSADRHVDRATNQPYYAALIEADAESLKKAGELMLQAGMPAEVFIRGRERTPLDYLVEPITQVLRHAGRER